MGECLKGGSVVSSNREVSSKQLTVGVAWYSREQCNRLRELADDKDALNDSYEEWLEGWNEFTKQGPISKDQLLKVEINVDDLAWWCQARNRPLNGKARSEYVMQKVSETQSSA